MESVNREQKYLEAMAKAEDLRDLLGHIAWTEVLQPAMTDAVNKYQKMLTARVLGRPVVIKDASGIVESLTSEQIAGRIEGIEYAFDIIKQVLRDGDNAVKKLRDLHLSSS